MSNNYFALWFRVVAVILALFGSAYVFLGLKILPVPRGVLVDWESRLYGAIMMGWGVTLVMVGRIAFKRADGELKRALLVGITVWLTIEAAASAWSEVWFNVGVDAGVMALFATPLVKSLRK